MPWVAMTSPHYPYQILVSSVFHYLYSCLIRFFSTNHSAYLKVNTLIPRKEGYVSLTPGKMTAIFLFLSSEFLAGCVVGPAPHLPQGWISHSVGTPIFIENTKSKLQVFITYAGFEPSHSALRLIASNGDAIFWDPGGDYGRFDDEWDAQYGPLPEGIQRKNDLILTHPPNVETFTRWRWTLHDTSVEVFEWELSELRVQELRDILVKGTDATHPAGSFSSWTFPLFCTMATSDFLRRFASPMIQLPERYFFPDTLAQALYTQSPSRVRVSTVDGQQMVYFPSDPTSVRQ